ncbi:MAG TPA: ABC transporter ATP-binding protein [Anaerohalosphaeraceae bacterium]|nr:ABC transporter ATP-binding protein [Anaerohalosphaeraceae bacterium]HRT51959.1 ABC transporter ATP-binding protein [Anaerohalosphaeraceae bacterium]HRT88015.1 ABC transporter ATP-binding protein [Anaerohalosphaeraceae bacterium]
MTAQGSEYAIETISLTKIFRDWWGRAKVVAVDKLELKIRYNEIYGLLGPNGSGKTTTLKMLLGLLHPTKGVALLLGGNGRDPRINERIGYLPEESYLYRYLTARETLDFYGRLFGLPSRIRKSRIDALLEMVGLTGMANRPVGTYSKGMARRIGLAQALINDPELLILDEPTSGMDPIGTRQIKDLLAQLAKRGKTILLCSHLLADVEDVCDRIGILYGGRMQVEGTVESLLQHRDENQIVTGRISAAALDRIRSIVEGEHATCEISSPMDRLEEFFIRTVTAAQEQGLATSGAMSTTKIGDFLMQEPVKPSILEQLVASDVHETGDDTVEQADAEVTETQPVEQRTDTDLLERLAAAGLGEHQTESVAPQETEGQAVVEETETVKRDVLDELIGRSEADNGTTELVDPGRKGDSEDA